MKTNYITVLSGSPLLENFRESSILAGGLGLLAFHFFNKAILLCSNPDPRGWDPTVILKHKPSHMYTHTTKYKASEQVLLKRICLVILYLGVCF